TLRKRETDCSRTSSRRRPSNCETAAFASRIFPPRSQTKTGSGALATMTSAARLLRTLPPNGESLPRLPETTDANVFTRIRRAHVCGGVAAEARAWRLLLRSAGRSRSEEHTSELQSLA